MYSAHRPCILCTVSYVSVHLVDEGFGLDGLPQYCWEDLVVDRILVVGCCLGSGVGYSWLALVGYWGLASWDDFVVQTPVPME